MGARQHDPDHLGCGVIGVRGGGVHHHDDGCGGSRWTTAVLAKQHQRPATATFADVRYTAASDNDANRHTVCRYVVHAVGELSARVHPGQSVHNSAPHRHPDKPGGAGSTGRLDVAGRASRRHHQPAHVCAQASEHPNRDIDQN